MTDSDIAMILGAEFTVAQRQNLCHRVSAAVLSEFVEKALNHHPSGCIDEALADGGEGAADLDIAFIGDLCAGAFGSELESTVSLHKADFTFAFYDETETGGWLGFDNFHGPIELSREAG